MNESVVDKNGDRIWYDLKSNTKNYNEKIIFLVTPENEPEFYFRPHREDGPAIIWKNGTEQYRIKGELHREDGPAVVLPNGIIDWCLNGEYYSFENWCRKLNKTEEEIFSFKEKWNII